MANPNGRVENLTPFKKGEGGHGRNKGSLNKKTIERTKEFRKYLEDNNFLCEMVKQILETREAGTLKASEAAKALDVAAKYLIKTTSQDQEEVIIKELTRSEMEQKAERIKQRLEKVIPKTLEEEEDE